MTDRAIHETTSLCKVCKNAVPARVVGTAAGEVWMRKTCPRHGDQEIRLSTDAAWYERTIRSRPRPAPPPNARRPIEHGCPFDCGACPSHEQKIRLPVVTITSACDLDCPICYVHNKNSDAYHMTLDEFRGVLDHLVADSGGDLDLINFTGGEPTAHPDFLSFLEASREAGVHRVAICTNGIRLAKDESLVARLAEMGGRVALSFDTFDPATDHVMQGAHLFATKMRCLELLEKYDVDTTLIPVMTRGVNDHEIGRIVDLCLSLRNVRHVEVHTITYTGQGGATFPRSGRITMVEVLDRIAETTGGRLVRDDFVPSPCAHPLCYQIAYVLLDPAGGPPIPCRRFLDAATVYDCLGDHLYLEPTPRLERAIQDAIDRLWTDGGGEAERTLANLNRLLRHLFPPGKPLSREEALRRSERSAKAVYVHSHMDEENFDVERAAQCCDSNCYADGSTVPICNDLVLYKEKDPRFRVRPAAWSERTGGVKAFARP